MYCATLGFEGGRVGKQIILLLKYANGTKNIMLEDLRKAVCVKRYDSSYFVCALHFWINASTQKSVT
jgi:hypothetical protein